MKLLGSISKGSKKWVYRHICFSKKWIFTWQTAEIVQRKVYPRWLNTYSVCTKLFQRCRQGKNAPNAVENEMEGDKKLYTSSSRRIRKGHIWV